MHSGQTTPVERVSKVKNFLHFWNSPVFFRMNGCCYGYCDQFCYWWILFGGLSMIGYWSQVSGYSQLSDYSWTEWLVKNKAANAPITFEENVMVMISIVSSILLCVVIWFCTMGWSNIKKNYISSVSQFLRNHTTEIELHWGSHAIQFTKM